MWKGKKKQNKQQKEERKKLRKNPISVKAFEEQYNCANQVL